jgi:phosphoglycolate phosphatase-like HAD superfamily hydrolase
VMELSWVAVQERFEITVPFERYFELIGRPFQDIMTRLELADRGLDIEPVYMAVSLANFELGLQYPGIDGLLDDLRQAGKAIGIITSKDATRTRTILQRLPATFDVVKTPEDVRRGKPAPDALLLAMAEVGVDPASTIYVGDMDVDHQAAARAGVDYIHAGWGYGEPDNDSCAVVDEPAALAKLLIA